MRAGIANGQVTGSTLVWTNGMAAWSAAQTVPVLHTFFATPPPMPPSAPPPVPQAGPTDAPPSGSTDAAPQGPSDAPAS